MTITPTAPSITPCPVPWCPDAGHHVWTHDDLTTERRHSMRVLVTPTGFGREIVVTAEVYETPAGTEPLVDLDNADQLSSRAQVERVIAAMREAADLAFGRVEGLNNPETPAELAVLHAVQEMAAGRAGQNAVIEAWERLTVARAREAVDMDEFDAAAAELITRAGHPEDVNRLVAAAVRYRKAHGALVDAEVQRVTR